MGLRRVINWHGGVPPLTEDPYVDLDVLHVRFYEGTGGSNVYPDISPPAIPQVLGTFANFGSIGGLPSAPGSGSVSIYDTGWPGNPETLPWAYNESITFEGGFYLNMPLNPDGDLTAGSHMYFQAWGFQLYSSVGTSPRVPSFTLQYPGGGVVTLASGGIPDAWDFGLAIAPPLRKWFSLAMVYDGATTNLKVYIRVPGEFDALLYNENLGLTAANNQANTSIGTLWITWQFCHALRVTKGVAKPWAHMFIDM